MMPLVDATALLRVVHGGGVGSMLAIGKWVLLPLGALLLASCFAEFSGSEKQNSLLTWSDMD